MSKEENHVTESSLGSSIFNIVKVLRLKCNSNEEGVIRGSQREDLDLRAPLNSQ